MNRTGRKMKKSRLYFEPVLRDVSLRIVFGVTLMAVLGVSSITPAFPLIIEELKISPQSIGMLITVFTLPGILMTPVLGILADRFGRKRILIPSLLVFGIAGTACAFIRDFNILLMMRFLQGIGAASLGSLNVTLIGDLFSGEERTAAMGYNASVLSVGTAGYPAIGGFLATLGWYYPFVLPIAAVPLGLIVLFSLKNPEPKKQKNFKEYIHAAWNSIKKRRVIMLLIVSTLTFIILYGSYLTYFPILAGQSFQAAPLIIGLLMSAMSIVTAVTSSQLSKIAKIFSKMTLIKATYLFYGLGLIVFVAVPNLWLLLLPTAVFGIGHGLNFPSIQTLLAEMAPIEYRAVFMSINGMVLRLGQTLGPVFMGLIYTVWGIEGAFLAGAGFSAAAFLLLLIFE